MNKRFAMPSQHAALVREVEPEPGETEELFLDRCIETLIEEGDDPDAALAACEALWDQRGEKVARKVTGSMVFKTVEKAKGGGLEFVLSDETEDRMGDVILASGWLLDNFSKNPVALFGDRSDFPVGSWKNLRIEGRSLRGQLALAPRGTSGRIDEVIALVEAGILRAVSVGFSSIETKPREGGGLLFVRQELLECSLVSIPANPSCLSVAKSLGISEATRRLVFTKHGSKSEPPTPLQIAQRTFDHRNKDLNAACKVVEELQRRARQLAAAPYNPATTDAHLAAVKSVRGRLSTAKGRLTLARLAFVRASDDLGRLLDPKGR
jgi:HK97 family phage prohead protease